MSRLLSRTMTKHALVTHVIAAGQDHEKSLKLDPKNDGARANLKKIREERKSDK